MRRRSLAALIVALALPLAVGAAAAVATVGAVRTWYPTLARPAFAPPNGVFAPVWTTLYVMMGVASWLVWKTGFARPQVRSALALYALQLLFNLAWSFLFFGLHRPLAALAEIVVLLALVAATTLRFARLARPAALLLVPYLAWVSFAMALNAAFWWLNRTG